MWRCTGATFRKGAAAMVAAAAVVSGCAGTAATTPTIPEGKGHLVLDAGGIAEVNFYVLDEATDERVFTFSPRASAASPSAYERGNQPFGLQTYLDPGTYTVVVTTDFGEAIERSGVEVRLGEVTPVLFLLGRFMLNVSVNDERVQAPFLLWDYQMRNVIGRGMTSTQLRHFITRPGLYKVRFELLGSEVSYIRDLEVDMGRVTPVNIDIDTGTSSGQEGAPTQAR